MVLWVWLLCLLTNTVIGKKKRRVGFLVCVLLKRSKTNADNWILEWRPRVIHLCVRLKDEHWCEQCERKLDLWPDKERMRTVGGPLGSFTSHHLPSVIAPDKCPPGTVSNVSLASSSRSLLLQTCHGYAFVWACTVSLKIPWSERFGEKSALSTHLLFSL